MKKAIIVAVVAFTGSNVCAQETEPTGETSTERKNQISLNVAPAIGLAAMSGDYRGRLYLQYRRETKDGFYWKADASYRNVTYSRLRRIAAYSSAVIEETDTTRTVRSYGNDYNHFTFRVGAERDLGERGISTLGVSLINGMTKRNYDYAEIDEELYSPGGDHSIPEDVTLWIPTCNPYSVDPADSCATMLTDVYYYSLGISANFNLNLPMTDKWMFSLVFEPQFMYHMKIDEETRADFEDYEEYQGNHGSFWAMRANVDLLLRYTF